MPRTSLKQVVEAAMAAAARGDMETAVTLARSITKIVPNEPNAQQIIGLAFAKQGRVEDAIDAFRRAESAAPNHPPILNTLGALLKEQGDYGGAEPYLMRATRLAPDLAPAHCNLAELFNLKGESGKARTAYDAALKADPRNAESWGSYALFLEERHDIENARVSAERALSLNPRQASAHMALAEIDARAGDHSAAAARIAELLAVSAQSLVNRAKMNGILARSLEKLGRYGEAFASSKAANDDMRARFRARMEGAASPRSPESVRRMIAFFERPKIGGWTSFENPDGPAPVFFLGFPRSGTTLLDQILSSCVGVQVLEEKATLADAGTDFIMSDGGLERLPRLSIDEVNYYRARYWERVESEVGALPAGSIFIDKLPLHTVMLGLIWRIFPDAKIIFSIRDPRDVVLSCFQQTFGMNVAMYQFLELQTAAAYYDMVMRLAETCREKFPYHLHEVRYEKIVSDFRGEIEPVLEFLGLPWSENAERFAETARNRHISTPSAKQVIQGIYSTSSGRWRNYATELAPVLPILAPWVRRLGYAE